MITGLILAAQETKNPIVPEANEIIWGSIAFVILFIALKKKAYPQVKKGMEARTERIRDTLAQADSAKDEAQAVLEDYRRQLSDAKNESGRIIEEARQAADKIRQDLRKQAEDEVAEIKQRAQDDITAQANRAMADLQARVSLMVIELTEKVVGKNLDRDANKALIEQFIREMETTS
ncbi:MAG: F0F1 ATP synthase subunit B [Actinomycetota bacterium]|nr:F0F1 ATP synthase subunit B [Actinomycetota bacterium]